MSLNTEKWQEYEIKAVSDLNTQCSLILESWGGGTELSKSVKLIFLYSYWAYLLDGEDHGT